MPKALAAAAAHDWLARTLRLLPPRSKPAEAIRDAPNRWQDLARLVDDDRIDLDTNPVERAIRSVALGRKGGADRWAIVATLIETARPHGIEPFAWPRNVLPRMVAGYPADRAGQLPPISGRLHG